MVNSPKLSFFKLPTNINCFNVKSVKTADARQNLVYNEARERWALTSPATDRLVKRHVVMESYETYRTEPPDTSRHWLLPCFIVFTYRS
jgi:hypothetical protein